MFLFTSGNSKNMFAACTGEDCKYTKPGYEYTGHISTTANGLQCARWDSKNSLALRVSTKYMPEFRLENAANYCRKPDLDPSGPWCFTTDRNKRWDYCDIPMCEGEFEHFFT